MKCCFYGTGAADWLLRDYHPDELFRHFSCMRLGDEVMIDAPSTFFVQTEHMGLSVDGIRYILYTHLHDDHFSPQVLTALCERGPVTVIVEEHALSFLPSHPDLTVVPLTVGVETRVGEYIVLPVTANHFTSSDQTPVHYIIRHEDKTVFYGLDGAWWTPMCWRALRAHAPFDLMVIEATLGDLHADTRLFEHNNLPMVEEMVAICRNAGVITDRTVIRISHLAKQAYPPSMPVTLRLEGTGISAAYDGEEVTF